MFTLSKKKAKIELFFKSVRHNILLKEADFFIIIRMTNEISKRTIKI